MSVRKVGPAMQDIIDWVKRIVSEFGWRHIGTYAASTTYGILLSVVPALIVTSAILPYTAIDETDVVALLLDILPDASSGFITWICSQAYNTSGGLVPLSFLFLLWSSGFGMMQLRRGLNHINRVRENRNYFLIRLISSLFTLLVMALMFAVLLLQVFARNIVDWWKSVIPFAEPPEFLTSAMRYVLLFAMALALFLLLYTLLPATNQSVVTQLPGALGAAVGWEVFSAFFSLYARYSVNLNAFYGSLFTVVVLLLWIYWCIYILLIGDFVNQFLIQEVYPLIRGDRPPEGECAKAEAGAGPDDAGGADKAER